MKVSAEYKSASVPGLLVTFVAILRKILNVAATLLSANFMLNYYV